MMMSRCRSLVQPGTRHFSSVGRFSLPQLAGEPFLHYAPGSAERTALKDSLATMRQEVIEIPCVVGGKEIYTGNVFQQTVPSDHGHVLANVHLADEATVKAGIESSLAAKKDWENMPFEDRAQIFRKAADLTAGKYRAKLCASVMLGQGKNYWQAEIDAAVEAIDFYRQNTQYAEWIYEQQPTLNSPGIWNRMEYRALEGFVAAITPFNFNAIATNLPTAPAMMGNTVVWKPSNTAALSNYLSYQVMREAGLPDGVINFVPADGPTFGDATIGHRELAGLHFTGSTGVFNHLWQQIGTRLDSYKSYPRVVGETGGKNFHLAHPSADVDLLVKNTVRGSFEYQGQKCSATSRLYCPQSLWGEVKEGLVQTTNSIKMGQPEDFRNLMCAVIDEKSFNNIKSYIEGAKADPDCEIIAGGGCDRSQGWFVEPTIIVSKNPKSTTMVDEIFGPVLTVYVYDDAKFDETIELIDTSTAYALTGSLFCQDRLAQTRAADMLRHSAGNFYLNDKCTGSVVGEQPFGGGRMSGTNDKAGSYLNLLRWASPRTIKENTNGIPMTTVGYSGMEEE